MIDVDEWTSLRAAADSLGEQMGGAEAARREIVARLIDGRLSARALEWHEVGRPQGFAEPDRPYPAHDGPNDIPPDFWQPRHAQDHDRYDVCFDIGLPATSGNWRFEQFLMEQLVHRSEWGNSYGDKLAGKIPLLVGRGLITPWTRIATKIYLPTREITRLKAIFETTPAALVIEPGDQADVSASPQRSTSSALPKSKNRGGRPANSGRYSESDKPLVAEGIAMVRDRRAASPNDAATMLASRAGGASERAKINRLRDKIVRAQQTPQNSG
jgi:hypothetical protein